MITVINIPSCPKCGCRDIRHDTYHYWCFKCGAIYNYEGKEMDEILKIHKAKRKYQGDSDE